MKLTEQSVKLVEQPSYDLEGCFKIIEKAARTCYASEPSTKTSKEFVYALIKSKHLTPLEFGTVYLKYNIVYNPSDLTNVTWFQHNKYSIVEHSEDNIVYYVTTNFRVLIERGIPINDYTFVEPDWQYHKKRLTFEIVTSIGISREVNRYRTHSIAERSTRYCNFTKDKFQNSITFIKPYWYKDDNEFNECKFKEVLKECESSYIFLVNSGLKPQEARDMLPLATMTKEMHCAYKEDWDHFLDQRYFEKTGKAHPDCKDIAEKIYNLIYANS